ncbi:hypothetical protein ACFL9U_14010, partial [Thermodesulfobacteriota bacterium]
MTTGGADGSIASGTLNPPDPENALYFEAKQVGDTYNNLEVRIRNGTFGTTYNTGTNELTITVDLGTTTALQVKNKIGSSNESGMSTFRNRFAVTLSTADGGAGDG